MRSSFRKQSKPICTTGNISSDLKSSDFSLLCVSALCFSRWALTEKTAAEWAACEPDTQWQVRCPCLSCLFSRPHRRTSASLTPIAVRPSMAHIPTSDSIPWILSFTNYKMRKCSGRTTLFLQRLNWVVHSTQNEHFKPCIIITIINIYVLIIDWI